MTTKITVVQIESLRTEAAQAGDTAMVTICDRALGLPLAQGALDQATDRADDLATRTHRGGGQFDVSPTMRRANEAVRRAEAARDAALAAWRTCATVIADTAAMAD